MKLLAIDTATEACSAAVLIEGEIVFRYELAPRQHADLILPMIDELLAETELSLSALDALAFGRGPGAFTGVRIATGVTQGLAFGADLPVIPVSDLAALAQGAAADHTGIISAIDARMGEIYWCLFNTDHEGLVTATGEEQVGLPEQLTAIPGETCFGVGTGWRTYGEILHKRLHAHVSGSDGGRLPHAKDILPLAKREFEQDRILAPEDALPVYLRNRVTGTNL